MNISYKQIKELRTDDLEELFLSVEWSSGKYPEKLKIAMMNSDAVYTAWNGGKLVGLINSMSDGVMNSYIQYLVVRPDYQRLGIGKRLVMQMLDKYKDYLRSSLIAYGNAAEFYRKCGFSAGEGLIPMSVSSLNT